MDQQLRGRSDGREKLSGRCAAALLLVLAIGACTTKAPQGAGPAADVEGTVHVCSSCHGPGGDSISSTFPRLAGQQKEYLVAQLKAFRDHTRADPHAATYMWGMAAQLKDLTIEGVAAYYAAQPPVPGEPDHSPDATAGGKIYTGGIAASGVPACMTCHGDKGQGNGAFPRLAAQHREVIERQLSDFASKARANGIMDTIAKQLTPVEVHEISAYIRTL